MSGISPITRSSAYRHDVTGLATYLKRARLVARDRAVPRAPPLPGAATRPGLRARVDRPARRRDPHLLPMGPRNRRDAEPIRRRCSARPKVVNRLPGVLRPREAAALAEAPGSTARRRRGISSRSSGRSRSATEPSSSCCTGRVCASARSRASPASRWTSIAGGCSCAARATRSARSRCRITPWTRWMPTCRPDGPPWRGGPNVSVLQPQGEAVLRARHPCDGGTICGAFAPGAAGNSAHPSTLVRHASPRRRGRHQSCAGTLGTRERCDHAALHARVPDPALPGLRAVAPEGLTWRRRPRRPPASPQPPRRRRRPTTGASRSRPRSTTSSARCGTRSRAARPTKRASG